MSELSALPPTVPGACLPINLPRTRPVPNVFETSWALGDPPMPWDGAARSAHTRRRSMLPWVVFAMMLGIGLGLWRDKPARARAVSQLHATRQQATAFIHR